MSLEKRPTFILSLLLAFCIIFGVTCIVAYNSYKKTTDAVIHSNETRANLMAELILDHQRAAIGVIRSYGSRPLLVDSVKRKDFEGALRHLADLVKNNPEMGRAFISNPDSNVWANFPVDREALNKDRSHRDWYKGVSKGWKPYISSVYKMTGEEKDLAIAVCVPIFDEKENVLGILCAAQSTTFFRKIIGEVGMNLETNITLLDQKGRIIRSNWFPYTREEVDYPSFDLAERVIRGEKGNVEIQDSYDGNRIKYVSFAPVGGIGWSIIVEKAKSDVIRSEYSYLILITAISSLIYMVVVLSLIHLRGKRRKLGELTKLAAELEERVRQRTSELEAANQELKEGIAERNRAEDVLRESERKYRELVQSANSIILRMDSQGRVTFFNEFAEAFLGYKAKEILGQSVVGTIIPETDTAGEDLVQMIQDIAINPERYINKQTENKLHSGEHVWIAWTNKVIRNKRGDLVEILCIGNDITERKWAEEALADRTFQLDRMNRELIALNAELDDFTHMASHDLQEPLRILTAYSDLLPKDLGHSLPERAIQDLGFITDAARRMQTLIQDLLALSRAGQFAKKRGKILLGECACRALDVLAMRVKETGAEIGRDDLPEVWGDFVSLTQLYQNLIGNALKFSGEQRPIIRLTLEERNGDWIFGVKDNGIGIEPKYAHEIFKPFKRLHGRAEYEGSGIGLAICRKIVERHGGKIWVESELGKGAHFRFTISRRRRKRGGSDEGSLQGEPSGHPPGGG
jgi:PAS domain S-box-containing protein